MLGLKRLLSSGKNNKLLYYIKNISFYIYSSVVPQRGAERIIASRFKQYSPAEQQYIQRRVDYYCKLTCTTTLPPSATPLSKHRFKKIEYPSVYFFDTYRYTAHFDKALMWCYLFGDVNHTVEHPSIVKSRPICSNNTYSVVMKLDKVRHFTFVKDDKKFGDKIDKAIFRGAITNKENRIDFMRKFSNNEMVDVGCIDKNTTIPEEWKTEEITLTQHLDYKFIIALEGIDVASNLKWVMSSNSVAIMPRPTCETWFMEGTLIPNHHYIEIQPDYSDLLEKIEYYIAHPQEAETIARNANNYVKQFRDRKTEKLISLMVLKKYFDHTN